MTTNPATLGSSSTRLPTSSMTAFRGPTSWCTAWLGYRDLCLWCYPTWWSTRATPSRVPSIWWRAGGGSSTQMRVSFSSWKNSRGRSVLHTSTNLWAHRLLGGTCTGIILCPRVLLRNTRPIVKLKPSLRNTRTIKAKMQVRSRKILKAILSWERQRVIPNLLSPRLVSLDARELLPWLLTGTICMRAEMNTEEDTLEKIMIMAILWRVSRIGRLRGILTLTRKLRKLGRNTKSTKLPRLPCQVWAITTDFRRPIWTKTRELWPDHHHLVLSQVT